MAKKKHRKLFPMLASETNKTLDCSIGICDPSCPYNCYQEPDYYAIPPWSSPQKIPAPSPSISVVYQESDKPSSSLEAISIIAVTGAVLFILLTGFFLVAKFVSDRVNRANHGRYQSGRDEEDIVEEEFQDREQVDHPIWLIRTTGLQQSIINSITICNYKRGDGLIERTDCPVCLNEFEEEESLRLLPKCNHAFHIPCIDTWLRSHTNCPLCRAGIAIIAATPRCSDPVDVTPGETGLRLENNGVSEDQDSSGIENRERDDESGFKEILSSGYRDSENTDPNSEVRIEIHDSVDEINQNSEDTNGDESETETEDKVKVLGQCIEPNGGDSISSSSHTENVDFPGKSCENRSRELTKTETEKEHKDIGDEGISSEENGSHNGQSWRSFDSVGSVESKGEATDETGTSQSGISSNTGGSFNKNKSSIFPL